MMLKTPHLRVAERQAASSDDAARRATAMALLRHARRYGLFADAAILLMPSYPRRCTRAHHTPASQHARAVLFFGALFLPPERLRAMAPDMLQLFADAL